MTSKNSFLLSDLANRLSPRRLAHSKAVARWAVALARIHGADADRAERAGLLHDAAKEWGPNRLVNYVRRHKISVRGLPDIVLHRRGNLLHGDVASHWAKRRGLVSDKETRNAMARHTLGHEHMGLLDKIIYVADFSSPDRRYAEAARVRRLARRDLDAALRAAVGYKIQDVIRRVSFLHPTTIALWNTVCRARP